jgi:hypothetical protein
MTKTEAERARRELQHALDALGDGAGRDLWGPGVVGQQLHQRVWGWDGETYTYCPRLFKVATAFDVSAQLAVRLDHVHPETMYACMRKVAPVLLEVLIEAGGG